MKIFLDTEFTGLHKNTTLISIGMVAEDNRTFYAEFNDYDKNQLDSWIKENVMNNLLFKNEKEFVKENSKKVECKGDKKFVTKELRKWLKQYDHIKIWSDCLSYDWVLFNDLFDNALNIPDNILYIPFDICTLFEMNDIDPDISREKYVKEYIENDKIMKHNSLYDAKIIKYCYDKLMKIKK